MSAARPSSSERAPRLSSLASHVAPRRAVVGSPIARTRADAALALALVGLACSGGERSPATAPPATTAPGSAGAAATLSTTAAGAAPLPGPAAPAISGAPTTSIGLVDMFPAEVDWPVVPASDAHDGILPPGVLPDDFAIVVRPRRGSAPFVELRPRAGMSGRWELVAADVEAPEDPSVDLTESLVWSVEVPARRVAGIYAFVRGHEETLPCGAPSGLPSRYSRRTGRVACGDGTDALALRARLDQLVADHAP